MPLVGSIPSSLSDTAVVLFFFSNAFAVRARSVPTALSRLLPRLGIYPSNPYSVRYTLSHYHPAQSLPRLFNPRFTPSHIPRPL